MSAIIEVAYPPEPRREIETYTLDLGAVRVRVRLLPTPARRGGRVVVELSLLGPAGEVLEHCLIDAHNDAEARSLMHPAATAFAASAMVRQRARATDADKC